MTHPLDRGLATGPAGLSRRAVLSGGASLIGAIGVSALVPGAASAASGRVTAAVAGATATVSTSGTYTVTTPNPAFTFTGTLGVAPSQIGASKAGSDALGAFHEIDFQYTVGGVARTSSIRTYDASPVVLFSTTYVQAAANAAPYYAFPAFSQRPSLSYNETFQNASFAPYTLNTTGDPGFSPYLAYDATGAYMLSPASHFATGVIKTVDGAFCSVISNGITSLPAGLTYQTALVFGSGPAAVYNVWGNALTTWSGKKRTAQNATRILAKFGYWSDNYATYYYTTNAPASLQQVRTHWESLGLALGYIQLDSWFYPKGPNALWSDKADGIYLYEADPTLFPDGLGAYQSSLGLPLVTHSRWIDPSSPYHSEYQMSGEVVIDPAYWNDRMNYLASNGVATFEQDWLGENGEPAFNLTDRDAYLGNMAAAAATNGLDIQYCMTRPKDFLQSTLYSAVTNSRVCDDGFVRSHWDAFLYGSHLASAVGILPWADVTPSTATTNLLLQTLSAGPVGVGDAIGGENAANVRLTMLADGTIVKPDVPIVPDDATYLRDGAGSGATMVATTVSRHGSMSAGYVFAYARSTTAPAPDTLYQAESATLSGAIVATDNSGYTGTGYADYQNASNDYVQWTVNAPTSGVYTLMFRYTNGGTGNRPLTLAVDGVVTGTLPFAPSGGWTTWDTQQAVVVLTAGKHTVKTIATGSSGGNIDYLGLSAGNAPCALSELGITTPAYVYDFFAGTGVLVASGSTYSALVDYDGSYLQVVPIGPSGIGFLGDAGKFASLGSQRISSLTDTGSVQAVVQYAPGDGPVTLHGYSPSPVKVTATGGSAAAPTFDPTTHQFSVAISPGTGTTVTVTLTHT